MRGTFDALRDSVGFVAAALLLVGAGRFASGAVADVAGDKLPFLRSLGTEGSERDPRYLFRPVDSLSGLDGGVPESEVPPELRQLIHNFNTGGSAGKSGESAQEKKPGRSTATLIITVGPERAEVFVNGVPVGRTPYVGDLQCARGNIVRVAVLPPKGTPIEREAVCRSGTITIDH